MSALYKYADDAPEFTITRESIMNFEKGCHIVWGELRGEIITIAGHLVKVFTEDAKQHIVNYRELKITSYPKDRFYNENTPWCDEDTESISKYVSSKLTLSLLGELSKIYERSPEGIKSKLRKLKRIAKK